MHSAPVAGAAGIRAGADSAACREVPSCCFLVLKDPVTIALTRLIQGSGPGAWIKTTAGCAQIPEPVTQRKSAAQLMTNPVQ